MLTPLQLKSNYLSLLADSESITGVKPHFYGMYGTYNSDDNITEEDSLTAKQWENLVEVSSIIESNENRLWMCEWHTEKECGTAHCIAGWAQSLAMNDTNYNNHQFYGNTSTIAQDMLSSYAEPFFYITNSNFRVPESSRLAEELVMKWFIKPILEEARRESYELSTKISQFIQKAKEETQVKELIAS